MNHTGSHRGHMWLLGAIGVGALFAGFGVGAVLLFAVLACAAMFGGMLWFVRRSELRPQTETIRSDDVRLH